MGYKEDFANDTGWTAIDASTRLNTSAGKIFIRFLQRNGVDTIIRYYASTERPKTLTLDEAKFLSNEGFAILPVFQDSSRNISHFSTTSGKKNARSAIAFAKSVGQPVGKGSTILFAVDQEYEVAEIDGPILNYFKAVKSTIGQDFKIGCYGSGATLSKLLSEKLIEVPWLSMSRAFTGTEQFFYSNKWALRQVPPERTESESGIGYDRNIIRISRKTLGAFQVGADDKGMVAWDETEDATLAARVTTVVPAAPAATDLLVTTEGLRLRDAPDGVIIRDLTIGERLIAIGAADNAGWRKVRSGTQEGFCFGKYLRTPDRSEVEALLRTAIDEWLRFDKGAGSEKVDPYCGFVREMWAAIGEPYDGRSTYPNGKDVPWSAAFISWVVRLAGPAYTNFQFASSHSIFVNNAIKARYTARKDKPFWGFRINEEKPALGDIIQRNRSGNNFSFSYAENHVQYESHSDIVVEVTPDAVRVLGGNVGDTVGFGTRLQEYHVGSDGHLIPDQGIIALLKNKAGI
ncbi:DUF2272 domain-containing protein [Methylobacterium sp. NEAU 140]|uniref:DUF2272 domain-containing protein n=1 Tax=Methylobacterium sp. NEAU 140 TaxID=3064945 RepID=UPI0027367DF0|nr:DUF2272 domain-containing protein [Methylobacterium sp. NEAU 140]MDP4026823.1 DUF2272 domain-containing protein [Methylobacterium sp. NEAU 140]